MAEQPADNDWGQADAKLPQPASQPGSPSVSSGGSSSSMCSQALPPGSLCINEGRAATMEHTKEAARQLLGESPESLASELPTKSTWLCTELAFCHCLCIPSTKAAHDGGQKFYCCPDDGGGHVGMGQPSRGTVLI